MNNELINNEQLSDEQLLLVTGGEGKGDGLGRTRPDGNSTGHGKGDGLGWLRDTLHNAFGINV
ncbi:MAG TPA: hypothetical protein VNR65_15760 [Geobacterales bacterium]|nr:hypothetical protein [Geobacterales bacterium]